MKKTFLILLLSLSAASSFANISPYFIDGNYYYLTVCENNNLTFDETFTVADDDAGQVINLSVAKSPSHGFVTGLPVSITSTGYPFVLPAFIYHPTAGFSGNDTLFIKVKDGIDSAVAEVYVYVYPLPVVGPITALPNVCEGNFTYLYDSVAGGTWSSSNDTIAYVNVAGTLTGLNVGNTRIYYTVTNICGSVTDSVSVGVIGHGDAGHIVGPSYLCKGSTAVYNNPALPGAWYTTDESKLVLNPFGYAYAADTGNVGIYYVVYNDCFSDTAFFSINISDTPHTSDITGRVRICVGMQDTLFNLWPGGVWHATGSSVQIDSVTGILTAVVPGISYVSYKIANGCGISVSYDTLLVSDTPKLLSPLYPDAVCDKGLFSYVPVVSVSGAAITWQRDTVPGILNSSGYGSGSITEYLLSGSYNPAIAFYKVTLAKDVCVSENYLQVIVKPRSKMTNSNTIQICNKTAFDFLPVSDHDPTTYTWYRDFTTGIIPSTKIGAGIVHDSLLNLTDSMKYLNYYIVGHFDGCMDTGGYVVKVEREVPPRPQISITPNAVQCAGALYLNFGALQLPVTDARYFWTSVNAAVWATGATSQYCLVNTYANAQVTVFLNHRYNGFECYSRDSATLFVQGTDNLPSSSVDYYSGTFAVAQNDVDSYQWGYDDASTLDSTIIQFETNQSYFCAAPDFANKKYWCIIGKNGCYQKCYYSIPAKIENTISSRDAIRIMPNPSSGQFIAKLPYVFEKGVLKVMDIAGRLYTEKQFESTDVLNGDLDLPNGVYMISVQNDKTNLVSPISIVR